MEILGTAHEIFVAFHIIAKTQAMVKHSNTKRCKFHSEHL